MSGLKFDRHIFICTNERIGNEKPFCGEKHGLDLVAEFKKTLLEKELPIKVRAQRAGCLDVCYFGPTVVVYPEGVFYIGVEKKDVEEIVEEHIKNGRIVERLLLKEKANS